MSPKRLSTLYTTANKCFFPQPIYQYRCARIFEHCKGSWSLSNLAACSLRNLCMFMLFFISFSDTKLFMSCELQRSFLCLDELFEISCIRKFYAEAFFCHIQHDDLLWTDYCSPRLSISITSKLATFEIPWINPQ